MNKRKDGPIDALTSLRFFAALLVVFFHDGQALFVGAPLWASNIIKGGYAGVPFFFILSGFILTYNYLPLGATLKLRSFWLARFARIYPIYAVSLILSAPLFFASLLVALPFEQAVPRFLIHGVAAFSLVQAWIPSWAFVWNGPAWSLSVEAFFYLLFPFLARGMDGKSRWMGPGALAAVVGLFFGLPVWLRYGNLLEMLKHNLGWANPLLWLPLFLLGMFAGRFYLRRGSRLQTSPSRIHATLATLMAGAVILICMAANLQRISMIFYCYVLSLPCVLLILLLADRNNAVGRCLSGRMFVRLGEASYALYILHRPVHEWFRTLESHASGPKLESLSGFSLYLGTAVVLSLLSVRFVEAPCRRWIKQWFGSGRKPVQVFEGVGQSCRVAVMR
jgi:peptidoglycan/LPS O-acetylase OafA/YrhL